MRRLFLQNVTVRVERRASHFHSFTTKPAPVDSPRNDLQVFEWQNRRGFNFAENGKVVMRAICRYFQTLMKFPDELLLLSVLSQKTFDRTFEELSIDVH